MADERLDMVSDDLSPTTAPATKKEEEGGRDIADGSVDNPAFVLRDVKLSESGGDAGTPTAFTGDPSQLRHDVIQVPDDGFGGAPNIRRQRPFSSSMISRRTASSTKSRASLSASITTTEYASRNMFSYREGIFDQAIEICKQTAVSAELDGEVTGAWLLTEIDHWDYEREQVVLLTDQSLLIIKFDFIRLAVYDTKRIYLNVIENIKIGDLVYPSSSMMPARDHGGLRIFFSKEEMSFGQRWNPWSRTVPFTTLTHHLLIYNKNESETVTFNVDDLAESLIQAVGTVRRKEETETGQPRGMVNVEEAPILIESYANLGTLIHNQSKLGFNLDRGGVSY